MANARFQQWLTKLKNTYRLVIMNDETFEEIGSYRLTRLNVYVLFSSLLVVLVFLITSLIVFTPLKQYIPGYGDINVNERLVELNKSLDEIESELEARQIYINNKKKVLTGNVESPIEDEETALQYKDTILNTEPIPEDLEIRNEVEREELLNINAPTTTSTINAPRDIINTVYFMSPLKGSIISDEFDPLKNHFGIDLVAPKNSTILSVLDGTVIMADWTYDTGYVITIQHDGNIISTYKHNSKLLKEVGDKVKIGEAIAIVGNTGHLSFGPHLHFELWYQGKALNPQEYISF